MKPRGECGLLFSILVALVVAGAVWTPALTASPAGSPPDDAVLSPVTLAMPAGGDEGIQLDEFDVTDAGDLGLGAPS